MSTLKTDAIEAATGTNTDLSLDGKGTGVPDLAAGFKVGSVAGVPTASIRDDAVTLAKLAAGTDGELITWDASGDPATVAVGTATHVLTSNGAGAAPTFQAAAGGGAWTLIATAVASASASLTITGLDSTYDTYAIALADIIPATDGAGPYLRVGDSSGIDSGASDYQWFCYRESLADTPSQNRQGDSTDSEIQLTGTATVGSTAGEGLGVVIYLHRPGDGVMEPYFSWSGAFQDTIATANLTLGAGVRVSSITLDRIQFLFHSGNVASGRMTIWGISHA